MPAIGLAAGVRHGLHGHEGQMMAAANAAPFPTPTSPSLVFSGADAALLAARQFLSRLSTPTNLLLAVSGGSDSTALLAAFCKANAAESRHRLVVCTVDHALRQGSAKEAETVAALCRRWSIPHETVRWAHDGVGSALQAQARMARYQLLAGCAARHGASLILTGHTADDQAETIAMRSARAGGAEESLGLSGMAETVLFDRRIWIARPFLTLSRLDLRAFLSTQDLGWIDDPSNDNPAYERVRIRQAGIDRDGHLQRAEAAGRRRRASSQRIAAMLPEQLRLHGPALAELTLKDADLDDPDMQRLLGLLAAILGGRPHGPGRESLAALIQALRGERSRFAASRCLFDRRGSRLFLHRERRALPNEMTLQPGAAIDWDNRFRLVNDSADPITIRSGAPPGTLDTGPDASVPPSVHRAAHATLPCPVHDPSSGTMVPSLRMTPRLQPFDTFLPCFDTILALRLDALFDREPFFLCPVHDVLS